MTEQFANLAQSTLSSPISSGQITITVANANTFPLQGKFRIVVQSFDSTTNLPISAPEIMSVNSVAGNVFTVTRAAESSANFPAIAFASGALVTHINTAAVMQAFLQNITGLITAGSNVTITGNGTAISPYSIAASGGGSGSIPQANFSIIG